MIKKEEIVYRCKLSSEFSSSDKDSFIELFNRVLILIILGIGSLEVC